MNHFVLFTALILSIACGKGTSSDRKQPTPPSQQLENNQPLVNTNDNVDNDEQDTEDHIDESPEVDPPAPQLTLIKTLSLEESSSAREHLIIVSVEVNPTKAISISGLVPSRLFAKCGDEIIIERLFELITYTSHSKLRAPSLVIPPELTCQSEIEIYLKILGYDYELIKTYIGTVSEIDQI